MAIPPFMPMFKKGDKVCFRKGPNTHIYTIVGYHQRGWVTMEAGQFKGMAAREKNLALFNDRDILLVML